MVQMFACHPSLHPDRLETSGLDLAVATKLPYCIACTTF